MMLANFLTPLVCNCLSFEKYNLVLFKMLVEETLNHAHEIRRAVL